MADNRYTIDVILDFKDKFTQSINEAVRKSAALEQALDGINKKLDDQEVQRRRLAEVTTDQIERSDRLADAYDKEFGALSKKVELTERTAREQYNLAEASRAYAKAEKERGFVEERAIENIKLIERRKQLAESLVETKSKEIQAETELALAKNETYVSTLESIDAIDDEIKGLERKAEEQEKIYNLNKQGNKERADEAEKELNEINQLIGAKKGQRTQIIEYRDALASITYNGVLREYQEDALRLSEAFEETRLESEKLELQNKDTTESYKAQQKIIRDLERDAKKLRESGFVENKANQERVKNIDNLRKAYVEAGGAVEDFDLVQRRAMTVGIEDARRVADAFARFKKAQDDKTKFGKIAQEASVAGDEVVRINAEFQGAKAEQDAAETRAFIESILGKVESKLILDDGNFFKNIPEIETVLAVLTRDRKIKIEPDVDETEFARKVTAITALGGAFSSIKEGLEGASRGVAAFDNLIRGLLVLTIALFFQQIFISVIALGAALTALVSSAVAAGAALGGALAAGAAQALPAIGVLAAFANRLTNVLGAVKQANLLQQQESYKGGQAANRQAKSLDGVVSAQERVKDAQDAVTEARKKAREALEDLILQEQRQSLGLESAQEKLQNAISSGAGSFAVAQARLDVQSAQTDLGRTREKLSDRQKTGIEGSPEVTQAQKQLKDAQRSLEQAKQSAEQAGASVSAAGGKLDFLLGNLSKAEKSLYQAILRLQKTWLKFSQTITEPLITSFTYAVNRVNQILKSAPIIKLGKDIGKALGDSFKQVFNFLLSDEIVERFVALGSKFQDSIKPITSIVINLSRIFLDLAEAGVPVLDKLLTYFDRLIGRFADFLDSSKGKNALADFFDKGTTSLLKFFDLIGAVGKLLIAIIGPAGGLKAGDNVLDLLTKSISDLADKITDGESKVGKFFRLVFDNTPRLLKAFGPVISALGEAIAQIFTPEGIKNVEGFGKFLAEVVIPAISEAIKLLGDFTTGFVAFIEKVPIAGKALEAFLALLLSFGVLARVGALFTPFQQLNKYLFTGVGKKNIFKIFGEDIDKTGGKLRSFLNAIKASDGVAFRKQRISVADRALGRLDDLADVSEAAYGFKDPVTGRFASKEQIAAQRGKGKKAGLGTKLVRKTPFLGDALMGAGFMGGSQALAATKGPEATAGMAARFGAFLGPAGAVAAIVAVIVAAIAGLLALSGKLDDVWRAIQKTFEAVFKSIKEAVGELAKELTGEKSVKKAFSEIVDVLKTIGNVLAAVLIPAIKLIGVVLGATIVGAIKRITAIVRFVKGVVQSVIRIFSGIKEFWQGVFSLDGDKIVGGLKKVAGGILGIWKSIAKLIFDVLTSPFTALYSLIDKIFPQIGNKIESIFNSVINTFIKGINLAIDGINKVSPFGDIQKLDLIKSSEQKRKEAKAQQAESKNALSNVKETGRESNRILQQSRDRRQYESERKKSGKKAGAETSGAPKKATAATTENAEKFLNAFNPETVKLSDKITNKLSEYWRTLRREARNSTSYVKDKLSDIRKDGGKDIDRFVNAAQTDLGRLRRSFRNNFLGIAAIVRNQMVNVSNIVVNQMQNAATAIYKGAKYMRDTLNESLKSVGAGEIKLTLSAPKIRDEKKAQGGFAGRANGGWIGNRGERGRDAVPTLLGRGEAVLNWGHQKLVEPALQQTYGFGLDDMFARTNGYHAGGPGMGLASGGRGKLFRSGRASWFGGPNDGMNTGTALGLPDTVPGIAMLNQSTLGKYFRVVSPQGRWRKLRQVDIGPAAWTGKILDITSAALKYFGYNEKTFPTGRGIWKVYGPVGKGGDAGGGTGGAIADIAMPIIKGGTKKMRELVTKATKKMVNAANRKLAREAPQDMGAGDISVPKGASGTLRAAMALAQRMGLQITSTTGGQHATNSWHYRGRAFDAAGPANRMAAFFRAALKRYGKNILELFYDPLGGIKNGQSIGAIGDHMDHVHLALARGGRPLQRFAYGGHIKGAPDGQPVPVIAHAGEWILNKRQQGMMAAAAGLSPNALKGKLGFSGGPYSFAGGGTVEPTKAFEFPKTLLGLVGKKNIFEAQLDKFGSSLNKLIENILSTKSLEKEKKKIEAKIADLKKGGTNDKEDKKIKDLETRLKNIERTSAVDKVLKSVRALTGTDGESGLLGAYYDKIKRTFDETSANVNLAAAGFVRSARKVGSRLKFSLDAIPKTAEQITALAQQQADAQEALRDGLIDTADEYTVAIAKLRKAADRIGRRTQGKGKDKKTVNVSLDRMVKEQEADQSKIDKLKENGTTDKEKEQIKNIEKRMKARKKDIDARSSIESEINNLEEQRRAKEQEAIEAENNRVEALKQGIENATKAATRNADRSSSEANYLKSAGEILSSFGGSIFGQTGQDIIDRSLQQSKSAAEERQKALENSLAEAKKTANGDPRFQETIDGLKDQLQEANLAVLQATADIGANTISKIQKSLEDATKQIDFEGAVNNARKSLAELLGNSDAAKAAASASIDLARRRQNAIDDALAKAKDQLKDNPNDPRFQQLVNDLTQQAEESALAVAQAQADLINQQIATIEKAFQNSEAYRAIDERRAAIQERLGNTTGAFNSRSAILAGRGSALQTQADNLRALLNDPNLNPEQRRDLELKLAELAVALEENTQETKDLKIAYLENQAEQDFQRAETARGLRERAATLLERSGFAGAAFNQRQEVLRSRIGSQQAQADALRALLNDPVIAGNAAKIEELTNKIADLDMSIQENTRETLDLNLQYQKAQLDLINERTTTTTGFLANAQTIFENIAKLNGTADTQDRVRIAQQTGAALNNEAQLLAQQVRDVLASGSLTGEGGNTDAINLLQQLLQAFSTGDPGSFAGTLESLASQVQAAAFAQGFDPEQRNTFLGLINALTNNTIQVTDNTSQLRELNGIANQPQPFSSTSWTRFRAAIFNGLGDVLPQFDIPQMATGGYITKGGMFELHPGEFVVKSDGSNVDQGDINITVNEANKPLDVTALASRIAFEKRTRK